MTEDREIALARSSKPPRLQDPNQRAKLIVELAAGQTEGKDPHEGKNRVAVELGRRGGLKGGKARAEKLSSKERSDIAKRAAAMRWHRPSR